MRYDFLGIPVDDYTMDEAVDIAMHLSRGENSGFILFLNTDVTVKADKNVLLKEAIKRSSLSLMDGKPPLILAKMMGIPLREKVSGSDFVPKLCTKAAEQGCSVFILGGNKEAASLAAANLAQSYKGLAKVGYYSPPFRFEQSTDGLVDVVMKVREFSPDILVVCLGCPKQEVLVSGLFDEFGVPCVVCAGATVDFLAGTVRRAPQWVSSSGFEWLYRFVHEPKRLFKRYFVDSWRIVGMTVKSKSKKRVPVKLQSYILKAQNEYYWWMDKLAKQVFIREYPKYLRKLGIKINEKPGDCWISPTVFFDSAGYDMIEIGDDCTVSFDAAFLVHDYSINNAFRQFGEPNFDRHRMIKRPIKVGNNCFIGARAIIMPGVEIGDNCIVGAGSVVRGKIPPCSIVSGNPAVVIASVSDFAQRHLERKDWVLDVR